MATSAVARLAHAIDSALPLLASFAIVRAIVARTTAAALPRPLRATPRLRSEIAAALPTLRVFASTTLGALLLAASNDLRGLHCTATVALTPEYAAVVSTAALCLFSTTTKLRVSAWCLILYRGLAERSSMVWLLLLKLLSRRIERHEGAASALLLLVAVPHFARCRMQSSGLALCLLCATASAQSARAVLRTMRRRIFGSAQFTRPRQL